MSDINVCILNKEHISFLFSQNINALLVIQLMIIYVFWLADFVKPNMTICKMLLARDMHDVTIYNCLSSSVLNHFTLRKWIDRHIFER